MYGFFFEYVRILRFYLYFIYKMKKIEGLKFTGGFPFYLSLYTTFSTIFSGKCTIHKPVLLRDLTAMT